jgi:hypothetical protein
VRGPCRGEAPVFRRGMPRQQCMIDRGEKTAQGAGSGRGGQMKLHSYTVTQDTGFSPNPFWGYCTLACCKPVIRRTAKVGDWVVGLRPIADGNRLVYAMQVEEILPYGVYFRDSRFADKIPADVTGERVHRCGDNIYQLLPDGGFQQLRSRHSEGTIENPETKAHDLGGGNVLIARTFYYFGSNAAKLPDGLLVLRGGRGHKNRFSETIISEFMQFLAGYRTGVHGNPTEWRADGDCREEVSCRGTADSGRIEAPREQAGGPHPCEPQRRSARTGALRRGQ